MLRTFTQAIVLVAIVVSCGNAWAQSSLDRERARPHYRAGWDALRSEAWTDAARAFQQAIDLDSKFEDAYYGLGYANMKLRQFGPAIIAYTKCRDLYLAEVSTQFTNRQEAQKVRRDRLLEIDEQIRQFSSGPQNLTTQERVRQLQDQRRLTQENISRTDNQSLSTAVPAFVSLALGSAYFRTGQLVDAEREYKAAATADPRQGEAFSNLAVVYLETGRFKEADQAVKSAERAGFKVHPQLKEDIKAKLKS